MRQIDTTTQEFVSDNPHKALKHQIRADRCKVRSDYQYVGLKMLWEWTMLDMDSGSRHRRVMFYMHRPSAERPMLIAKIQALKAGVDGMNTWVTPLRAFSTDMSGP